MISTNYYQKYIKYKSKYINLKKQEGGKDRPSPSDSATKYKVGTKKKGNDGNIWIIVENKNGVKRWKLYSKKVDKSILRDTTNKSSKTEQILDEYITSSKKLEKIIANSNNNVKMIYDKLKKIIIPSLRNMGKCAEIIPPDEHRDDYMPEKCGEDWAIGNYMYFNFFFDRDEEDEEDKYINMNIDMLVGFSYMDADEKRKVIKLFTKNIPKHFKWTGRNTDYIFISYNELKDIPKIDLEELRDNDEYPLLHIWIDMIDDNLLDIGYDNLNIMKIIKKYFSKYHIQVGYGGSDLQIDVSLIEKEDIKKIYPKLIQALDNAKKESDITQRVESYNINYWLDGYTEIDPITHKIIPDTTFPRRRKIKASKTAKKNRLGGCY